MWNPLYIGRVPHFQGKQQNAWALFLLQFQLRNSIKKITCFLKNVEPSLYRKGSTYLIKQAKCLGYKYEDFL